MPLWNDIFKRRIIRFKSDDPDVTARARELLSAVQGVTRTRVSSPGRLTIHYDVRQLSLQMIEQALTDVGFQLHDSLVSKINRSLIAYCEDALRDALGASCQHSEHQPFTLGKSSNHDPRPYHWRNYT